MNGTSILDQSWPPDLDPADVPFRTRSVTVLQRMGYFDDPTLLDTLTEVEVLSWWNAGPKTVVDIRETGNEAIRLHHEQAAQLGQLRVDMAVVAGRPWAKHIWWRDPRFAEYLPKGDATVYDIATVGSLDNQRFLWGNLEGLTGAIDAQATLSLPEAVSEYVEGISGQHGERLRVLLARTGLDGQDPITGREASRRLNRSQARIQQIRDQLLRNRDRCRPPAGVWMPQLAVAERDGWPDTYTEAGLEATRGFVAPSGSDVVIRLRVRPPSCPLRVARR